MTTTAQRLHDLFAAHISEEFGFSPLAVFVPTEFQAASKAAFDKDYNENAHGSWTFGDVRIEDVALAFGGVKKEDADGSEYMVFADGSALAYSSGRPVLLVAKWVRNDDVSPVD